MSHLMYPADQQTWTLPDQQGKWQLSQRRSIQSVQFPHPQIQIKGLVIKVPGQIWPVDLCLGRQGFRMDPEHIWKQYTTKMTEAQ